MKTRVGVFGLGFMGATHLKAWAQVPAAALTALGNPSGRHLDGDFTDVSGNVGDQTPLKLDMMDVHAFRSLEEMLKGDTVEVVDLCTPTHVHADQAIAALEAGKHVICEKPMARTSAEARRMIDAARAANRLLMPAMCLRFWPEWQWLKHAVDSGEYGRVLSAQFTRIAQPPAWGKSAFLDGAKSGGALLDLHIHDVDFVLHLFGKPKSVNSAGYTKVSGWIDHLVTRYEVARGAMVHAEGGWAMSQGFGFKMAYLVNFENATADYDCTRSERPLRLYTDGKDTPLECSGPDGYIGQLTHFIDCVQSGATQCAITPEDGLHALEVCEAEEASIKGATPIKLLDW